MLKRRFFSGELGPSSPLCGERGARGQRAAHSPQQAAAQAADAASGSAGRESIGRLRREKGSRVWV